MKTFTHQSPAFVPTLLQSDTPRDPYLETTHIEVLMTETQRLIGLKSQEIAAHTSRLLNADGGLTNNTVSQANLVKALDTITAALTQGFSGLSPLSPSFTTWVQSTVSSDPEKAKMWRHVFTAIRLAASAELDYNHFALLEVKIYDAQESLRYLQVALELEQKLEALACDASSFFIRNTIILGLVTSDDIPAKIESANRNFLQTLVPLLKSGNELGIKLNIARYWAEQIAPHFDFSQQEWHLWIGSLQQTSNQLLEAHNSRTLAPLWELLMGSRTRLAFCAVFFRNFDSISSHITMAAPLPDLDLDTILKNLIGEVLLDENSPKIILPTAWIATIADSPLAKCTVADFTRLTNATVTACRPLCERNWIDWMEEVFTRVLHSLILRDDFQLNLPLQDKLIYSVCLNLRQGLAVFKTNHKLEKDLGLVIELAMEAQTLSRSTNESRIFFRENFVLSLGLIQSDSSWQHGKTLIRSLRTAISQSPEASKLWDRYQPALALMEEIPSIMEDLKFVLHAYPQATRSSLGIPASVKKTLEHPSLSIIRTSLSQFLRYGTLKAATATLDLLAANLFRINPNLTSEDLETIGENLQTLINERDSFSNADFKLVFNQINKKILNSFLSYHLWLKADDLGLEITNLVYRCLPEYPLLAAETQTHSVYTHFSSLPEYQGSKTKAGATPKARDISATLRRVALALEANVSLPSAQLQSYWLNLVSIFIVTRPHRTFKITREQMFFSLCKHYGKSSAKVVDELVKTIYETAPTAAESSSSSYPPMQPILPMYPGWSLVRNQKQSVTFQHDSSLKQFLNRAMPGAYAYATGLKEILEPIDWQTKPQLINQSPKEGNEAKNLALNLPYLLVHLHKGLAHYTWAGWLASETTEAVKECLHSGALTSSLSERFFVGLFLETDSLRDISTRIVVLDYLQAVIDFHRQCSAGLELSTKALEFAVSISNKTHLEIPKFCLEGVSVHTIEEANIKCSRDLGYVISAFAEIMADNPSGIALFNAHRYLFEKLAPYVPYGSVVWRVVWQQASLQAETFFSAASARELRRWFTLFEEIGESLKACRPISHKLNAIGKKPVFSTNPEEEAEWSLLLTSLWVLQYFNPTNVKGINTLRAYLAGSVSICQQPDFSIKLAKILELIRSWVPETETAALATEVQTFQDYVQRMVLLDSILKKNTSWSSPAADSTLLAEASANFTFTPDPSFIRLALFPEPDSLSAWGAPACAHLLSPYLKDYFSQLTFDQVISSTNANLGDIPQHLIHSAKIQAHQWIQSLPSLSNVWAANWSIESVTQSHLPVHCDPLWTARRLSLEAVLTSGRADDSMLWFQQNVINYLQEIRPETFYRAFEALTKQLADVSPNTRHTALAFQRGLPGLLLSVRLNKIAPEFALRVVIRSFELQPHYAESYAATWDPKQLQERCASDTHFHLRALADRLLLPSRSPDATVWWNRSITPFLTSRSVDMLPSFLDAINELANKEFSGPEAQALKDLTFNLYPHSAGSETH